MTGGAGGGVRRFGRLEAEVEDEGHDDAAAAEEEDAPKVVEAELGRVGRRLLLRALAVSPRSIGSRAMRSANGDTAELAKHPRESHHHLLYERRIIDTSL